MQVIPPTRAVEYPTSSVDVTNAFEVPHATDKVDGWTLPDQAKSLSLAAGRFRLHSSHPSGSVHRICRAAHPDAGRNPVPRRQL